MAEPTMTIRQDPYKLPGMRPTVDEATSLPPAVAAELLKVQEEENTPARRRALRLERVNAILGGLLIFVIFIAFVAGIGAIYRALWDAASERHSIVLSIAGLFFGLLFYMFDGGGLFSDSGSKSQREYARRLRKAKARVEQRERSSAAEFHPAELIAHTVEDHVSAPHSWVQPQSEAEPHAQNNMTADSEHKPYISPQPNNWLRDSDAQLQRIREAKAQRQESVSQTLKTDLGKDPHTPGDGDKGSSR